MYYDLFDADGLVVVLGRLPFDEQMFGKVELDLTEGALRSQGGLLFLLHCRSTATWSNIPQSTRPGKRVRPAAGSGS